MSAKTAAEKDDPVPDEDFYEYVPEEKSLSCHVDFIRPSLFIVSSVTWTRWR